MTLEACPDIISKKPQVEVNHRYIYLNQGRREENPGVKIMQKNGARGENL